MRQSYRPLKRRQSKAFALRRQELNIKDDSNNDGDKTENVSDFWNATTSKLQTEETLINDEQKKEPEARNTKKSFDDEYLKGIMDAEISGVSESAIEKVGNVSIINSNNSCVENVLDFFENEQPDAKSEDSLDNKSEAMSFNRDNIEIIGVDEIKKGSVKPFKFEFNVADAKREKRKMTKKNDFIKKSNNSTTLRNVQQSKTDDVQKEAIKTDGFNNNKILRNVHIKIPVGEKQGGGTSKKKFTQKKSKHNNEKTSDDVIKENFSPKKSKLDNREKEETRKMKNKINVEESTHSVGNGSSVNTEYITTFPEFEDTIVTQESEELGMTSYIKNIGDVAYIKNINDINSSKNQIAYLLQNEDIETSIVFLKPGSYVKKCVADKSFSLIVLKGCISLILDDKKIFLRKNSLVVINKNDEYFAQNSGKNEATFFITYAIK